MLITASNAASALGEQAAGRARILSAKALRGGKRIKRFSILLRSKHQSQPGPARRVECRTSRTATKTARPHTARHAPLERKNVCFFRALAIPWAQTMSDPSSAGLLACGSSLGARLPGWIAPSSGRPGGVAPETCAPRSPLTVAGSAADLKAKALAPRSRFQPCSRHRRDLCDQPRLTASARLADATRVEKDVARCLSMFSARAGCQRAWARGRAWQTAIRPYRPR